MDEAVSARGLTKRFGKRVAVDAIDFTVRRGETFGFLGPNGAGKTSTMRMIACVSPADGGSLRVLGMDPRRDARWIRSRIGVVPQEDGLDTELTVRENLVIYGRYFGLRRYEIAQRVDRLLDFVRLRERSDSKITTLSGGMRRRLAIARALIADPELLLLDEPTAGLDPQARHLVWERLDFLRGKGVTQILTTHYMDEAERLCDRLVIMDGGRIVAEGSPAELVATHVPKEVVEVRLDRARFQMDRPSVRSDMYDRAETLGDRVLFFTDRGEALASSLQSDGFTFRSLLVRRANLEDVFLALTGRTLVE